MGMPEAVQRQAAAADAIEAAIAQANAPEGAPAAEPAPEPAAAVADPQPGVAPAPDTPAVAPVAPPAVQSESHATPEVWEQRYKTLQGMFKAQLNRSVEAETAELRAQLAALTEKIEHAPKPAQEPEAPVKALVSKDDVENYGTDMTDFVRRVALEVVQRHVVPHIDKRLQAVTAQLGDTQSRLGTVTEKVALTDQQVFNQKLTEAVPNWQSIDTDVDFIGWLDQLDPFAGVPRKVLFASAVQAFDATRVATFFRTWADANKPAAAPAAEPRRAELERQVTPGRSAAVAPTTPTTKRTWTQRDIAAFYDAVRRGEYRGRDDEAARIENDIFAAQADGRLA